MEKIPYHSALKQGIAEEAEPLQGVHTDAQGNTCFVWDVTAPEIPEAYYECDLIYAEPSWPGGLERFDERAGVKTESYAAYATAVARIITELGKPTVLFVGANALRHTPPPDFTTSAILNGNTVQAAFWNGAFALGNGSQDIIRSLAERYDRVGDFCCGYGTTGRLFMEAGKTCVLTDYNAKCCGFVAREMKGWGA